MNSCIPRDVPRMSTAAKRRVRFNCDVVGLRKRDSLIIVLQNIVFDLVDCGYDRRCLQKRRECSLIEIAHTDTGKAGEEKGLPTLPTSMPARKTASKSMTK